MATPSGSTAPTPGAARQAASWAALMELSLKDTSGAAPGGPPKTTSAAGSPETAEEASAASPPVRP